MTWYTYLMRYAVAVVLALTLVSCHPPAPAYPPTVPALEVGRVTVWSLCKYGSKAGGTASGIAVDPVHVLTAYHVVEDCPDEDKRVLIDGRLVRARVETGSPNEDVALLRLAGGTSSKWVPIGPRPPVRAWACVRHVYPNQVQTCGRVVRHGSVTLDGGPTVPRAFRVSMTSIPGNSGAGVLDARGRLVGLVIGGDLERGRYTWVSAIPPWVPGRVRP